MISEKELKKELKAINKFIKWLEKNESSKLFQDAYGYRDGLIFALKGRLY